MPILNLRANRWLLLTWALGTALAAGEALAADIPTPKTGTFVARDFRFHTGEVLPELKLHYTTVGEPGGEPVLVLHGTAGSGTAGRLEDRRVAEWGSLKTNPQVLSCCGPNATTGASL